MARQKRMQGFYKRNGTWWIRTDPVTKKRRSTHCTDAGNALQWKIERERIASSPAHVAAQTATISEWLGKFLQSKREGRVTAQTVSFWESKVGHLERLIGSRTLSEVTPSLVDTYVSTRRREGVGDYTIQRELQGLIGTLKLAKRAGQCPVDFQALTPPDLDGGYTPVQRALTPEEIGKLLRAMPTPKWQAFVAICVGLGCRKSEAFRVRREDFERRVVPATDATGNVVEVESYSVWIDGRKTESSNRVIPVLSAFVELVKSAWPELPIGPLDNVYRTFQIATRNAGIEMCSPNDLRRSNATILGERGLDDKTIGRMLGHTSAAMSLRTYNQAKAVKLAVEVEKTLAGAEPIVIDVPDAADKPQAPGRKRSGGSGSGGVGYEGPIAANGTNPSHDNPCGSFSARHARFEPATFGSGGRTQTLQNKQLPLYSSPSGSVINHVGTSGSVGNGTNQAHTDRDGGSQSRVRDTPRLDPFSIPFGKVSASGQLVPLIDAEGRVVAWEALTLEDIERDLSPELYRRRPLPVPPTIGADRLRMRSFERFARTRLGDRLEVTP